MDSRAYSAAIGTISEIIISRKSKQKSSLASIGPMHVRATTIGKVADCSWIPYALPSARSLKWPSVVVKVVCLETGGKLQEVRFEDLFLHEKSETHTDFILTEADLETLRTHIWRFI